MEEKVVDPETEEDLTEDQKLEIKAKSYFQKPKKDETSMIGLVLAAMQMQQETIIEQQKTISIYARQATSYEQSTQQQQQIPPEFDINSLLPILEKLFGAKHVQP